MSLRKDAMRTLDVQLDVLNYYGSDEGQRVAVGFVGDQVAKGVMPPPPGADPDEYAALTGLRLAHEMTEELGRAASYYVTPEMMALCLHAGETAPATPFEADGLPTPSGFVLLPEPLVVADRWGKRISSRAFGWWTTTFVDTRASGVRSPGLLFAQFSTKVDRDVDDYMAELHRDDPALWLHIPSWSLVHWMPLRFGERWAPDVDEVAPPGAMYDWIAALKAFFLLVRQEIAVARPEPLDRAHARRLRGLGLPPEYGDLRIVVLRRTRPEPHEHPEAEPGAVEWSHRWIVSGYWSDQFHPSCARCREHRRACRAHEKTWVESFVKGPPNRPLIVKDRVFVWKR